jgi:hypothetical protein
LSDHRRVDLARYLASLNGQDPDEPIVRLSAGLPATVAPAWQDHFNLAGAVMVLAGGRK